MNTCEKYEETLWLDVYGEVPAEKVPDLKQHTNACPRCREKAEELHGLLRAVRETVPVPRLSAWESENLCRTVKHSLKKENKGWLRFPDFLRFHSVPALLTACMLVFFTGWFGLREWREPAPLRTAKVLKAEEMQIIKNYEVISNLELLEEMDNLEKLVKTVDQQKYGELFQNRRLLVRKAAGNEKHV